jgi:hypothetical protein
MTACDTTTPAMTATMVDTIAMGAMRTTPTRAAFAFLAQF